MVFITNDPTSPTTATTGWAGSPLNLLPVLAAIPPVLSLKSDRHIMGNSELEIGPSCTNGSSDDKESAPLGPVCRLSPLLPPPLLERLEAARRRRRSARVTEPGRGAREGRHQQVAASAKSSTSAAIAGSGGGVGRATKTAYSLCSLPLEARGGSVVEPFPSYLNVATAVTRQSSPSSGSPDTQETSTCRTRRRGGSQLHSERRGGCSGFERAPLFVVGLATVLLINCLHPLLVAQAYSLETGSAGPTSGTTDGLGGGEKVFDVLLDEPKQIHSPEPGQLLGEPEQSFTTRGAEFVTEIFSRIKSKTLSQASQPTTTPTARQTTPDSSTTAEPQQQTATATKSAKVELSPTTTSATTNESEPSEENERPGSEDDDDDAEGCKGISAHESAEGKNLSDAERLVNLQSCIQGKVKQRLLAAARGSLEIFEKLSLSGGCTWSLMNLMTNLGETKSFAFKFLDASAKVPSGVMYGLLSDFGDFDQCLSARSNPSVPLELEAEENAYSGKYCLMSVKLNYHVVLRENQTVPDGIIPDGVLWDDLVRNYWTSKSPKGFQVGVCLPSRCTNDDLDQLYRHVAESYNVLGEIISCQDGLDLQRQHQPDLIQQVIIGAFYALIIVTVLGSFVDRYYPELATEPLASVDESSAVRENPSCCRNTIALAFRVLICFSVAKNWKTFMRKDYDRQSRWCQSTNRNSPTGSVDTTNRTDKTTVEGVSLSSSSTMDNIESNTVDPHENRGSMGSSSLSSRLGQLTVKIQPYDCVRQEQRQASCLSHLSGLKLLVIFWITIGHSFLYPSANNYQHYRSIINMNITRDSVWFATTNFTLGIDMLLYMTGLVFVYKLGLKLYQTRDSRESLCGSESNGGGIVRLIFKKILRFWPTYVTVIAFAIVVPLLSDGPRWPEMVSKRLGTSCRQNWWSNLLFINNLLAESEICLPSSWFVSVSMQLFLIGSIVVVLERKYSFRVAALVLGLLLIVSSYVSFLYAFKHKLRAPVIRMDESFVLDVDQNIWGLYINTFNNLGPFLVGMAGGYLLLKTQAHEEANRLSRSTAPNSSRKTNLGYKSLVYEILIGLLVLMIAVLVLSSVFHKEYSPIGSATYWSLHRIGWAIVTGYIIHNCETGKWQLLNDLLSLSTLIPFSRLVFIAYLVYPIFIHLHSGSVRDGLHISIYNMFNIYTTRLVLTFITALFIHLLVELPFCSIEEIYLNRWILRIENKSRYKDSSKFHPLLAVAPIVYMQTDQKPSNLDQFACSKQVNPNPQIQSENLIGTKQSNTVT